MASGKAEHESDEHLLCDTCRKIDLQVLLQSPSPGQLHERFPSPAFRVGLSAGCVLCHLLLPHLAEELAETEEGRIGPAWELRSASYFGQSQAWKYNEVAGAQDSVILMLLPRGMSVREANMMPIDWVFCSPREETSQALFQPRPVQSRYNLSAAISWLRNCDEFHNCVAKDAPSLVRGMKLIDCNSLDIVAAKSSSRWIALSYVWSTPPQPDDTESAVRDAPGQAKRLPKHVSRTVQDAIIVTRELGHQFLWVDEFCIDQNDEEQKMDQIRRMDRIYQGADLTIVATTGEDKNHGLQESVQHSAPRAMS